MAEEDTHVWRIDLLDAEQLAARFGEALTPDECERGNRFRAVSSRIQFIAVRGWLRHLLASYVDAPASDLRFCYGLHGKPMLAWPNPLDLRFNLSHSGKTVLVAVARGREVGVDVEWIREGKLRLAERFFSAGEVKDLRALAPAEQVEAFYRVWTRKEAFVKARGEGLSLPLRRFSVSVAPSDPPAILWIDEDVRGSARWSAYDLPEIPGYAAALVVEGEVRSPRCWQWRDPRASQG